MKKVLTLTVLLLTMCHSLYAQGLESKQYIEKLNRYLAASKPDTNRVLILSQLCVAYRFRNPDSLDKYAGLCLELSRALHFPKGEIQVINSQGTILAFQGDAPRALELLFEALRLSEQRNYPLETAISLNNIGTTYWFINDFPKALEYTDKALRLIGGVSTTPNNLFREPYWKAYISLWLGFVYLEMNKPDSAYIYLQRAYQLSLKKEFLDMSDLRPTILMGLGNAEFKLGNRRLGLNYLLQSINLFSKGFDSFGAADACECTAELYGSIGQTDSAIIYAQKALDWGLRVDYKPTILKSCRLLAAQYTPTNIKKAYYYLEIASNTNEALFGAKKVQELQRTLAEEQQQQRQLQEVQRKKENRLKRNSILAGLGVLLLIITILYRNNLQKKKANTLLQQQKEKVETTLLVLKSTQAQLIQSEKLASLGELTAGIAHEIQNPLNFVNNFAEVSVEMLGEMKEEIKAGNTSEVIAIADDLEQNLSKINHHGQRASSIVKGMLEHSRASTGVKEPTDLNALADEYLRLAYHGLRAKDNNFNAKMETHFDPDLPKVSVIPQDIARVLLNLINNAFYAVAERSRSAVQQRASIGVTSSHADTMYQPTVTVSTQKTDNHIILKVQDNGPGIPESIRDKIFQPFFTTKPTGQGTGLGLSLAYDIVTKGHGGTLEVESTEEIGSAFILTLPVKTNA